jgi:cytidylate kinase
VSLVVAIDGPSGSGKSSVSRAVAKRLGLAYLDTGAMYRAATWWCLSEGISLADQGAVADEVRRLPLVMGLDPARPMVHVGGVDVAAAIRETWVSEQVSALSTNLAVRAELVARQRALVTEEREAGFSDGRGVVAEGRDITTVVAPDAEVRVLLTANASARLARRALEVHGAADAAALAATRDQVVQRDARDSTVVDFQTPAEGVELVDSSNLDLAQTVEAVLDVVERLTGRRG